MDMKGYISDPNRSLYGTIPSQNSSSSSIARRSWIMGYNPTFRSQTLDSNMSGLSSIRKSHLRRGSKSSPTKAKDSVAFRSDKMNESRLKGLFFYSFL